MEIKGHYFRLVRWSVEVLLLNIACTWAPFRHAFFP